MPMATVAQRFEADVPIAELVEHPDNPRRGDESAIEASMAAHGFYGAVLVQTSSRRIIAGNHRTRVARRRGEQTVPVLWLDVDDDQAKRLLLVDNRTNDLAEYADDLLASLLASFDGEVTGTGFDESDLERLLAALEPEALDADSVTPFDRSALHVCPYCAAQWYETAEGPQRSNP
jgi:ParB-like chromosome segregation protein Spo0J